MSSELDSISGFCSILGLPSVCCSQLHLGGICSDSRNFDRGYLDNHWADDFHLLQARSTRDASGCNMNDNGAVAADLASKNLASKNLSAELNLQIHPM